MEKKESRITKKITIADIADMAGVTKSTVSRYFNGGSVKGSTREKIQEIVKAHDYEPNTCLLYTSSRSASRPNAAC